MSEAANIGYERVNIYMNKIQSRLKGLNPQPGGKDQASSPRNSSVAGQLQESVNLLEDTSNGLELILRELENDSEKAASAGQALSRG